MTVISIDIEGTKKPHLHPWQYGAYMCSVGICKEDGTAREWLFTHVREDVRDHQEMLKEIQDEINAADMLVAHNAKFDLNWLKTAGLSVSGKRIWCTEIADYLLSGQDNSISTSLDACAARHKLGQKIDKMKEYWNNGYQTDEIPLDIHIPYLRQDCRLTLDLYHKQKELIDKFQLDKLMMLCCTISNILSDMELTGVGFDKKRAYEFIEEYNKELDILDNNVYDVLGYKANLGSSDQLSAILFGGILKKDCKELYATVLKSGEVKVKTRKIKLELKISGLGFEPAEGTESEAKEGIFSTSKDVINALRAKTDKQKKFLDILKARRKAAKVISTFWSDGGKKGYIAVVGIDGRLHPSFNQTVTVSGRLSSSNPNGQNLPRGGTSPVKKTIVPKNDCIINIDLAQIEYRVAAELSRDPVMMEELVHGYDVHTNNAVEFFNADPSDPEDKEFKQHRFVSKTVTFRLQYGGSAYGFNKDSRMPDYPLTKWKTIVAGFKKKYSGLTNWQQRNIALVKKQGFLRIPSGRILKFKQSRQFDGSMGYNEPDICNYPVQSFSADLMFLAMAVATARLKALGIKSSAVLQVHDSLVFDAFKDEVDLICKTVIGVFREIPSLVKQYWGYDFVAPIDGDCEVGPDYGTLQKYKVEI